MLQLYMAKFALRVFHEKEKHMENAWFLANYNEAKTMPFPGVHPNALETNVAHLAMYRQSFLEACVFMFFLYFIFWEREGIHTPFKWVSQPAKMSKPLINPKTRS